MTEENKKMEIVFAPGCFDNFEGTQEELDEMIANIQRMAESGEMFEKAVPLSEEDLEEMDDTELLKLADALGILEGEEPTDKKLH